MNKGIYIWKNKINDKVYIGASSNLRKRKFQHLKLAENGSKYEIHKAIRDLGKENFIFSILEFVEEESKLEIRENYWIEKYNSIELGYNTSKGYNSISFNNNLDSIKINLSEKASQRKWIKKDNIQKSVYLEEIETYLSNGWELGRVKFSKIHKKQLSESHKGIKLSNEAKDKLSKLWSGRNHSEETKKKMSDKLQGRYSLDWYIKKYGESEGIKKYTKHQKNNSESKKGNIWINKKGQQKQIKKNQYEKYKSNGWKKGRK